MSRALDYAHRAASAWIDGLEERPVAARATSQELAAAFQGPLPAAGHRPEEVIAWLTENANRGSRAALADGSSHGLLGAP